MSTVAAFIAGQLAARQRRNPQYSLRSFARDLGMNPGTVSAIVMGRRSVPKKSFSLICDRLALSPRQRAVMRRLWQKEIAHSAPTNIPAEDSVEISESHYQILAEWEHFAVLSLMRTKGFSANPNWMAKRLGVSVPRIQAVLTRLESSGFIKWNSDGRLIRTTPPLKTSEGIVSAALRAAHAEEMSLAAQALTSVDVALRDISSMTMAMSPSRLSAARELIKNFRNDLAALCDEDGASEVYQLCMQLFPLTKMDGVKHDQK